MCIREKQREGEGKERKEIEEESELNVARCELKIKLC